MTDAELVRAVAVEVLGCTEPIYTGITLNGFRVMSYMFPDGKRRDFTPQFDANHMMLVVEAMIEKGFELKLGRDFTVQGLLTWVKFTKEPYSSYYHNTNTGHAVCLAALEAVRGSK